MFHLGLVEYVLIFLLSCFSLCLMLVLHIIQFLKAFLILCHGASDMKHIILKNPLILDHFLQAHSSENVAQNISIIY